MRKILIVLMLILLMSGCSAKVSNNIQPSSPVAADDGPECAKGMVNDTYPGSCGSYVDNNNNGICDYSE